MGILGCWSSIGRSSKITETVFEVREAAKPRVTMTMWRQGSSGERLGSPEGGEYKMRGNWQLQYRGESLVEPELGDQRAGSHTELSFVPRRSGYPPAGVGHLLDWRIVTSGQKKRSCVIRFRKTNTKEFRPSVVSVVASNRFWSHPQKTFWLVCCVWWSVPVKQYKCSKEPKLLWSLPLLQQQWCGAVKEKSSANIVICIRCDRKQKLKVHIVGIYVERSASYTLVNVEEAHRFCE